MKIPSPGSAQITDQHFQVTIPTSHDLVSCLMFKFTTGCLTMITLLPTPDVYFGRGVSAHVVLSICDNLLTSIQMFFTTMPLGIHLPWLHLAVRIFAFVILVKCSSQTHKKPT